MPELVGEHVHAIDLRPRCMACSVLDLSANDRPITQDGVGVELDDQVCGTRSQQLGWSNGRGGNCKNKTCKKLVIGLIYSCIRDIVIYSLTHSLFEMSANVS